MGDLKTNWRDPGTPTPGLGGASIVSSGSDPLIDSGGEGGLQPVWPAPVVGTPAGAETPNSVSGLPAQPNRFEPSDTPPAIPDLTDRNPGTVDRR